MNSFEVLNEIKMIMGITDELWITPVVPDRCSDLNFSRENHPCVPSGLLDLLHYANNFTNFCNYGGKTAAVCEAGQ